MHFDEVRLDRVFREVKELVPLDGIELLTPSVVHGVVPQSSLESRPQQALRDSYLVSPAIRDDFVISMSSHAHGLEWCGMAGGISPDYTLLRPICDRRLIPFLRYALKCGPVVQQLSLFKTGIRMGLRLQWHKVRYCTIALPPAEYALRVVPLLDRETARIDALIKRKTLFIDLLREKRQALTTRAVTRGLDRRVPMQDSGVEWLGQVPQGWRVVRLRFAIAKFEQGWSPDCFAYAATKGEWGVLKAGCVNRGIFDPLENKALPPSLDPRLDIEVHDGDILMSRASGSPDLIGSVARATATEARLMLSDKTFRIKLDPMCDPDFFAMAMGSGPMREQIKLSISGAEGLANNLAQASIKDFFLALPSLDEQRAIWESIMADCNRTDLVLRKTEASLALLKERRAALITAAVTGQIDVFADQPAAEMEPA